MLKLKRINIMNKIQSVVLAGGSGTRLWPLSRKGSPKQFVSIGGEPSLFQSTLQRALNITGSVAVVAAESHQFMVKDELAGQVDNASVMLEPCGKNTAPAIAIAAMQSLDLGEDAILLVMPSDHLIKNEADFLSAIKSATEFAKKGKLITFGAKPEYAETGYGYINLESVDKAVNKVARFVEKPNETLAKEYCESGDYFWNTGIFMFKASSYLSELKQHSPTIYDACKITFESRYEDLGDIKFDSKFFAAIPEDSIDYAVLEKSDNVMCAPVDMGWNDLGAWNSIAENLPGSQHEKVISKSAVDNHVVMSNKEKAVSLIGVSDVVVVDTDDALLIVNKDDAQQVKAVVDDLKAAGEDIVTTPKCVHRPWGTYETIDNGNRYKVKRITVKPGASLSLQLHHHRAEHWIVVTGTAQVTNGDKTFLLSENESTYIPIGVMHRLENPGKFDLELIEVQSGSYLEENDIVRVEDTYGRVEA